MTIQLDIQAEIDALTEQLATKRAHVDIKSELDAHRPRAEALEKDPGATRGAWCAVASAKAATAALEAEIAERQEIEQKIASRRQALTDLGAA
jgi:hypothetical protein